MPITQWRGPGARPWRSGWASSSARSAVAAGGLWAPSSSSGRPRQRTCCSRPGQRAAANPARIAAVSIDQPCSARAWHTPRATAPLAACTAPGRPQGLHWPAISRSPAAFWGRGSTQHNRAPAAAAWAVNTCRTWGAWGPLTATAPARITPAFSAAMLARSGPRNSRWSSPIEARAITPRSGWQVVASSRPPSPTSSTTRGRPASAKARNAAAVTSSNGVSPWALATGAANSSWRRRAAGAISSAPRRMRSVQPSRCGEV